mmetsp:Transcript_14364/g.45194  ORF Transcript_14364/g.45194 Transcript_14364/m.45194 type:complete len:206 (-) Transcript_14364:269-886(-)
MSVTAAGLTCLRTPCARLRHCDAASDCVTFFMGRVTGVATDRRVGSCICTGQTCLKRRGTRPPPPLRSRRRGASTLSASPTFRPRRPSMMSRRCFRTLMCFGMVFTLSLCRRLVDQAVKRLLNSCATPTWSTFLGHAPTGCQCCAPQRLRCRRRVCLRSLRPCPRCERRLVEVVGSAPSHTTRRTWTGTCRGWCTSRYLVRCLMR